MNSFSGIMVVQLLIALGLINVWLVRPASPTAFRGGAARSLKQEFGEYGLPDWMFYAVGSLKLAAAALLIAGIWAPAVVVPAATTVSLLMLGAIGMHVKIRDPWVKSLPAVMMLMFNVALLILR